MANSTAECGFDLRVNKFMMPCYRISPFSTYDLHANFKRVLENHECQENLGRQNDGNFRYCFTKSGSDALELSLSVQNLAKDDEVAIFTTTGNYYVSGCVTRTIEKFCKWGRSVTPRSKVILIIHEFGKIFKDTDRLSKLGLPIIEDFAHAFSALIGEKYVFRSDFNIFSLSKFLPVQYGGLLLTRDRSCENVENTFVKKCFFSYSKNFEKIFKLRKQNYDLIETAFKELGFSAFFDFAGHENPGVFMFNVDVSKERLQDLKSYVQSHGIECSVFYGQSAFFIPCHHRLRSTDIKYFSQVIANFFA